MIKVCSVFWKLQLISFTLRWIFVFAVVTTLTLCEDCYIEGQLPGPTLTISKSKMSRICPTLTELRAKLTEIYPFGGPKRYSFPIPNDKISWDKPWPSYQPPYFTAKRVLENKEWADPEEIAQAETSPKWNSVDCQINRQSYTGNYKLNAEGLPLNPAGRTGLAGRGVLGKWGPNHAADPIVTRWKHQGEGQENVCTPNGNSNPKILQFIGIQRRDTEEWAIPGGMVDAGEETSSTLKREFFEEVFSIDNATTEETIILESSLSKLFENGEDIYKGYVDDPRNTDNAWMETHAVNFHADEVTEKILAKFPLKAGSDAKNASWIDISSSVTLYASHANFIKRVAELKGASW